ncbi:uncharacterized protein LOC132929167 [Rhopalosiphum padi]|uniref:uncharacterized protein LOC132929167 n=1 Tax=Rhopalosiphum padi TaxID=40932 RepID=UPI00298DD2FD|nr:uncharacterized protein LOC132929167 [Rhopalosiphum padi]
MLNLNDNNLSLNEKDSHKNDATMNFIETPNDDYLQECNSSKTFYSLKKKYNRNNLIKKDNEDDSLSLHSSNQQNPLTSYPIEESRKSDVSALVRRRHITYTNNLKHFNIHPTLTLNLYNKNYSNSLMINSNPNNDVSIGVTCSQSVITEPIIPNDQSTLGKNVSVTESWREINHVDKIKLTALLFQMNSLTKEIMPFVNLHALANPFLQIPIQVCRMANSINLNMAEVLCRKRIEVAIISWMAITLDQ